MPEKPLTLRVAVSRRRRHLSTNTARVCLCFIHTACRMRLHCCRCWSPPEHRRHSTNQPLTKASTTTTTRTCGSCCAPAPAVPASWALSWCCWSSSAHSRCRLPGWECLAAAAVRTWGVAGRALCVSPQATADKGLPPHHYRQLLAVPLGATDRQRLGVPPRRGRPWCLLTCAVEQQQQQTVSNVSASKQQLQTNC